MITFDFFSQCFSIMMAQFRGFFGTYTVRAATESGLCLTGACAFPRRGEREPDVRLD